MAWTFSCILFNISIYFLLFLYFYQVKEEIFRNGKDSGKEFGTVNWSMNVIHCSNAKKGPHKNCNGYKDFSDKELDSQICIISMEYSGIDTFSSKHLFKLSKILQIYNIGTYYTWKYKILQLFCLWVFFLLKYNNCFLINNAGDPIPEEIKSTTLDKKKEWLFTKIKSLKYKIKPIMNLSYQL